MLVDESSETAALAFALREKTNAEAAQARAASRLANGRAAIWWSAGLGMAAAGVGVGLGSMMALAFWGYAHVKLPPITTRELSDIVAASLSKTVIRTEGTVTLAPNSEVSLKEGSIPRTGEMGNAEAAQQQHSYLANHLDELLTGDDTGLIIFKTVRFSKGTVYTSWQFKKTADQSPFYQSCQYAVPAEVGVMRFIMIGENGTRSQADSSGEGKDELDDAFTHCVWANP